MPTRKDPTSHRVLLWYPTIPTCPVMAQFDADVIWVDWEHSTMNSEIMTTIVQENQTISEGQTMAFVRVPDHMHTSIMRAMDAGASIIAPVSTQSPKPGP
ncbi:hypothetical protein GQ43DRAFT_124853 [Delitschia confertaspora ATCC 74209]|uniref:HpcH/HpaI aldolase/citrate lyase domain-containing protein n=1 Tax=Delitschia confertaspora ATCC 74209 TaxID=1513339 RepID=A0A9P4JH04_9PLEO|nr:hypothetical protein GQ43DRAFT_124853 [Delitschia confertaspora ATCC 74209]